MLYAIIGEDVPDSAAKRNAARPLHLDHLKPLLERGALVFAGPHPAIDSPNPGPAGFTGSLIIAEFESLEAARNWAKDDPYAIHGVFERVAVKPVLRTYP